MEQLRERAMVKEKAAASQISELESELSRMRVVITSLRREKLDVGFGGEIEEAGWRKGTWCEEGRGGIWKDTFDIKKIS